MDPHTIVEDGSSYGRARRRGAIRRVLRRLQGRPTELLALDEVRDRLGLVGQGYAGVKAVPVDRIVGSVDRSVDFDRDFGPRADRSAARWRRLEQAFDDGAFPPIEVYEVDGRYFVEDGHHRVAIARDRGIEFIDASVVSVDSPLPLPDDIDVCDLVHLQEERRFLDHSGLGDARPGTRIRFSRPQGFAQLLELLQAFGYSESVREGRVLPAAEVAGRWWRQCYQPTVEAIDRHGLHDALPYKTIDDLFLHVHQRQQAMSPVDGQASLDQVVQAVLDSGHPVGPVERGRLARDNRRRRQ
jgi:hypothetical protein